MENKFRNRLVNASMQECANALSISDIESIFTEIAEDGTALVNILKDIGKTSQGRRFLTLCQREDDLDTWCAFIRHESGKEGSKWNKKEMEKFYNNLSQWQKRAENPIDNLLKIRLKEKKILGEIMPSATDLLNWRRTALRKCLHNIIKGGYS